MWERIIESKVTVQELKKDISQLKVAKIEKPEVLHSGKD